MKTIIKVAFLAFFCFASGTQTTLNALNPPAESMGGAYLTFAGKFGGEVSLDDLKQYKELGIEGCAKGSTIIQFTMFVEQAGRTERFSGNSGSLAKDVCEKLESLSVGDAFWFNDTRAKLPSGGKVDVWSKKFVVV